MIKTIEELVFNTIEVSAAQAAYSAFEARQRGDMDIGHTLPGGDPLDEARERLGGPSQRAKAFFNDFSTADLWLLTVLYYSASNWRGNNDDESTLDPEREVRQALLDTRGRSEEETRKTCLYKLKGVGGSVRVSMLLEGLRRFGDAASRLRAEFSIYERAKPEPEPSQT